MRLQIPRLVIYVVLKVELDSSFITLETAVDKTTSAQMQFLDFHQGLFRQDLGKLPLILGQTTSFSLF